jgi:hypothetical protein
MSIGYFSDEFCDDLKKYVKVNREGASYYNQIRRRIQRNAIHFALPHGGFILPKEGDMVAIDTDILRPPFPVTVIEYPEGGGTLKPGETPSTKRLVMAVDDDDGVILFPAYYSDAYDVWHPPLIYWRLKYGRDFSLSRTKPRRIADDDVMKYSEGWSNAVASTKMPISLEEYAALEMGNINQELSVYIDFCLAMSQYETEIVDQKPDAQAQKLRRLRSKPPLFTYKIITITGKRKVFTESKGGTHASPATHLRRGHWRNYKSGKRGWVEAALVNGKDGMVVKDYRVEARHGQ